MEYRVVFDVTEAGYRYWWGPLIGTAIAVIGVLRILLRRRHPGSRTSGWRRYEPEFMLVFGAFAATSMFLVTYTQYRELVAALERREYVVVEGVVHDFVPGPLSEHPMESFEVAGHRYKYSNAMVQEGFNNTQSHGGPMREGLRVRIADVGGRIARLEIAK